jgi:predicted nuclease of predicted toxin-antitoxin system
MKLYIDADLASAVLAGQLRNAGHGVQLPAEAARAGAPDAAHMQNAIREDRVVLSRNRYDFKALSALVLYVGGRHPGILLVGLDNRGKRDMKAPDIVQALRKLEAAHFDLSDQVQMLNHWRRAFLQSSA